MYRSYYQILVFLMQDYLISITVLRSYFLKAEPKIIMYRDNNKFSNNEFRLIINTKNGNVQNVNDGSLSSFMNVSKDALDKVVPLKQKYFRANDPRNKDITKAVVTPTRLRNNYLKNRCDAITKAYNTQKDLCLLLVRKAKLNFFDKLNNKKVSDNKTF